MSLSAYTKAINGERDIPADVNLLPPGTSPTAHRMSIQARSNWIRDTQTQEFFKKLSNDINTLEKEARQLACQYPQHQNPWGIINRLVRAEELRNLIKTHGQLTDTTTEEER